MKRITNKLIALFSLCFILMSASAIPTYAGSLGMSRTAGFTSSWWNVVRTSDGATLKYGFNTFLFNEDYSHANHTKYAHVASVINGKGAYSGLGKIKGYTDVIEVRHNGNSIRYYCDW